MSTHVGAYPDSHLCSVCSNLTNIICWDDSVLATPRPFHSYAITCSKCCSHKLPHDHDWRPPVNTDYIEMKRRIEVISVFEITGDKSHADKLVDKVNREMYIHFGNIYKGEK